MTTLREAAQQALEALEYENSWHEHHKVKPYVSTIDAITALRAALEQQEPDLRNANPIGLTPPQKALQQAQFRADALAQQEQEPGVCGRCGGLVYDPVVAQQEQEPVATAWIHDGVMVNAFPWPPGDPRGCDGDQYWQGKGYAASPLYTTPPRREWKSLSKEEIHAALPHEPGDLDFVCARAIEAKLKEKNNG